MNFPFEIQKANEAASILLRLESKWPKLIKLKILMYLVERKSFARRHLFIFGGRYFSSNRGPILKEKYDFKESNEEPMYLSEWEIEIIHMIYLLHSEKTSEELIDWCDTNIQEYNEFGNKQHAIRLKRLVAVCGVNQKYVEESLQFARAMKSVFKY